MGTQDVVVGITNAYYMWLSISILLSNSLFQSDNIHISKMIVDKTVHNYVQISRRIRSKELLSLIGICSISSKPSLHIGVIGTIGYMLYR